MRLLLALALIVGSVVAYAAPVKHPYRFCYLSDIHYTTTHHDRLEAFVDSMSAAGCAFGIITGDWAEDGFEGNPDLEAQGDTLEAILGRASFPWYMVLGNHEALASDTLGGGNPYNTSRTRYGYFNDNYGFIDTHNLRLILTQNNCNESVNPAQPESYRVNNPFNGGWAPASDWDGIDDPDSPQSAMINTAMSTLRGRVPLLLGHRAVYGSDTNNAIRWSYITAGTDSGYVHRAEARLKSGHRGLNLNGDQHITLFTQALIDSGIASLTQAGFYHHVLNSGALAGVPQRAIDTTECFVAGTPWLQAYMGRVDTSFTSNRSRTSVGVEDTLTTVGDPDFRFRWCGVLFTMYGDVIVRETFRVPRAASATADWYIGEHNLVLVDKRTLYMDVRGR